jgi:hypothetical protein
VGLIGAWSPVRGDEPTVDFNREVRPILARNCFACHGQDPSHRAADLRLDQRDLAIASRGDDGAVAIVPGDPDSSEMIFRVTAEEDTLRMPPPKSGPGLSADEVEVLTRWIEQGANYAQHWAFVPPVAVAVPEVKTADGTGTRNPIDAFIRARLEREHLEPAPEADRSILFRRASLDLRGLPPTREEIDAFLADTSADAYEKAVDRMMADPAFGERWARVWLDLARYADSAGYGSDPLRPNIWRYRDWVIDAFNANMPYDRFTIEQIAGDLLPSATLDQKIATAFHRNTMTNTEGGTDDEEFRVAAIKDRVDTTAQAWMGLTMGCAKCHTHKYDPITQKEYYSVFAIFNQTADADRPDESPTLPAPTPAMTARLKEIDAALAPPRARLDRLNASRDAARQRWERDLTSDQGRDAVPPGILALLDVPPALRSPAELKLIAAYHDAIDPQLKAAKEAVAKLEAERPKVPAVPVMVELASDKKRETRLLLKGNFLDPGETVEPGTPEALHPWPADAPRDRLGLARWLMSPANPLTARVAVNRYWSQLFGAGLVETEEDFGTQGDLPSHPELLDWLAVRYRDSGWDTKAIIRLIVTSATYRQSSRVTPELLEKDPKNRLLARSPRLRLEAEMVRDQALAISGLLSRQVGGPSVFPEQPPGLWQAAFNGERTWATSPGADRHRRALYTFWRRTIPYPSMATFDAPSRETCTIRRSRTNNPLQAFVTLNDPVYVECAQALARRIVAEGGSNPDERVRYGLKLALSRVPSDAQVAPLVRLYEAMKARYAADPDAAKALAVEPLGPLPDGLAPAEAAAWTAVANVLLNLDAVLTRG